MSNKAKGTAKTEIVIGTAATKLAAAVKSIQEAAQIPAQLEQSLTDYNLKVTDLETKITNLDQEYQNKKAQHEIDLGLAYKAAQKQFTTDFLNNNGLIAVVVEEDKKVREELAALKANFAQEVNNKVAAATSSIKGSYDNQVKISESEYKAKEAGNLAKIENLTAQLQFANEMANKWEKQLNDERDASVKRASAGAVQQTITTGNGK